MHVNARVDFANHSSEFTLDSLRDWVRTHAFTQTLRWINPRECRIYIMESSVTNQRRLGNRAGKLPI